MVEQIGLSSKPLQVLAMTSDVLVVSTTCLRPSLQLLHNTGHTLRTYDPRRTSSHSPPYVIAHSIGSPTPLHNAVEVVVLDAEMVVLEPVLDELVVVDDVTVKVEELVDDTVLLVALTVDLDCELDVEVVVTVEVLEDVIVAVVVVVVVIEIDDAVVVERVELILEVELTVVVDDPVVVDAVLIVLVVDVVCEVVVVLA